MAPSSGHLLVPKVLKIVQFAVSKATTFVRSQIPNTKAAAQPVPVYVRTQARHPLAYLKQAQAAQTQWTSGQTRTFASAATRVAGSLRVNRSKYATTRISKAIHQNGLSPFASTLRPNLTGGTLPRTAGGYSLGGVGKARHFSHTSVCHAQVVHNVSAGMRAFLLRGGKVRYDGVDPKTGEKRFRAVTATQDKAMSAFTRSNASARGTNLEFKISPTVTALANTLSHHEQEESVTLQTPDLLKTLSGDFARSLQSLSSVVNDLQRLSSLGSLPIALNEKPDGPVIVVRFPGCDADIVSRLCDEVGVMRGIIKEDAEWQEDKEVQMALLFPFAPAGAVEDSNSASALMASDYFFRRDNNPIKEEVRKRQEHWGAGLSSPALSKQSSFDQVTLHSHNNAADSVSGYESIVDPDAWVPSHRSAVRTPSIAAAGSQDFDGVEGIYKFLQVCDDARRYSHHFDM